ncbi:MAG TPA: hypothetical protein PLP42_13415 [Acidobacteriota bacterium]|nr:hypothetical protein [Acidobacteriota bacterium]
MSRKIFLVLIWSLIVGPAVVEAGTPEISAGLAARTLREMDLIDLKVTASDPEGHQLVYEWEITNDETGKAVLRSVVGNTAKLGVYWAASPGGSLNGKKIEVTVKVSHKDPAHGSEVAETVGIYTVQGVNRPPVPSTEGSRLGTPQDRIPSGHGVMAQSYYSSDPDGDTFKSYWALGTKSGGKWITSPIPDYPPALVGSEGGKCSFTVLPMTAPIDQIIKLELHEGLHVVKHQVTAYLRPADGSGPSQGNRAPTITFPTNPVQASPGSQVQLVADVEDLDGDALDFGVVLLQTSTTVPSSSIHIQTISSTKKRVTATVTAPSVAGNYDYRFTATERSTTEKLSDVEILRLVVATTLPPGDGGPGETEETQNSCEAGVQVPTITVTPDPKTKKPLFYSGSSVLISAVSYSPRTRPAYYDPSKTLQGVDVTWDYSQLTAAGITPVIKNVGRVSNPKYTDSTCTFTVPPLTVGKTINLTITAKDVYGCSTSFQFAIRLEPQQTSTNQPPVAKIQYKKGSEAYQNAPTGSVAIETTSQVTVTLNAGTSTDDGGAANLTYTWSKQDSISAGGVTLGSGSGATSTLQIEKGTKGTVTVTLTAKDQENAIGTATITFVFIDPAQKPIARAEAKVGGTALAGPVDEGTVVTLDGSGSSRQDNTTENLTYQWTQTAGPSVEIQNANQAVAQFTAPAATETATQLKFELIVSDAGIPSDPAVVTVDLSGPCFYFSQVAIGPLRSSQLRTVLLLVNRNETAAKGVRVNFFTQNGTPLEIDINGEPWNSEPFDIPPLSSKRLVFTGQDSKIGWAQVESSARIAGLLLYQIVDPNENVESELGLYSTEAATRFVTFFDTADETALAVANTTSQDATVYVKLFDEKNGKKVFEKNLFQRLPGMVLPGMHHDAKFLDSNFLGELPLDFSTGTLMIESDVPISITVLKTKGGVIFSTLPVATTR